jgi:hypothetical protein
VEKNVEMKSNDNGIAIKLKGIFTLTVEVDKELKFNNLEVIVIVCVYVCILKVIFTDVPAFNIVGCLKIENCEWKLPNVENISDKCHIYLLEGSFICINLKIPSFIIPGFKFINSTQGLINCDLFVFEGGNNDNDLIEIGHINLAGGKSIFSKSV